MLWGPLTIAGVQGTFRVLQLPDGGAERQELGRDGTWRVTDRVGWGELMFGAAARFFCDDPGVCCPD